MRSIEWTRSADRDLRRLDRQTEQRVVTAITRLAETGQGNVLPLVGYPGRWRLRVGDWRVLFEQDPELIKILRVVSRDRAYRS